MTTTDAAERIPPSSTESVSSRPLSDEPLAPVHVEFTWPPARYWVSVGAGIIGLVVAILTVVRLQGVLLVVLASFVLALGTQPALTRMEKLGLERWQAMTALVLGGIVVAGGIVAAIVPVLISQLDEVMVAIPDLLDDLRARGGVLAEVANRFDWSAFLESDENVMRSIGGLAGTTFNVVTVAILTPYFAYAFPSIKRFMLRLLKREDRPDFLYVVNESVDRVAGYVAGNLTVSAIAVGVSFVVLLLLGLPFPLALAVWIGLTDLIPVVGVFLGAAPVVGLAALEGTGLVIASVLFIVIYQQIENYVIGPRIMKKAVDLSPASVILALMIGGSLAGIIGALLALPVAALVKVLVTEFVVARRIEKVRTENGDQPMPTPRRKKGSLGVRPLP